MDTEFNDNQQPPDSSQPIYSRLSLIPQSNELKLGQWESVEVQVDHELEEQPQLVSLRVESSTDFLTVASDEESLSVSAHQSEYVKIRAQRSPRFALWKGGDFYITLSASTIQGETAVEEFRVRVRPLYELLFLLLFIAGAGSLFLALMPHTSNATALVNTPSLSPTFSMTPSSTNTATPSSTFTVTPTPTNTPSPTFTMTPSPTASLTNTATATLTATYTPTMTGTPCTDMQCRCEQAGGFLFAVRLNDSWALYYRYSSNPLILEAKKLSGIAPDDNVLHVGQILCLVGIRPEDIPGIVPLTSTGGGDKPVPISSIDVVSLDLGGVIPTCGNTFTAHVTVKNNGRTEAKNVLVRVVDKAEADHAFANLRVGEATVQSLAAGAVAWVDIQLMVDVYYNNYHTLTATAGGKQASVGYTLAPGGCASTQPIVPVAGFTYDNTSIFRRITFTNTSTNATSFAWTFTDIGNGTSTYSQETNPTYVCQGDWGRTIIAKLTAYGLSGSDTYFQSIELFCGGAI